MGPALAADLPSARTPRWLRLAGRSHTDRGRDNHLEWLRVLQMTRQEGNGNAQDLASCHRHWRLRCGTCHYSSYGRRARQRRDHEGPRCDQLQVRHQVSDDLAHHGKRAEQGIYVQFYDYVGTTPVKGKAYNLGPGIYRGYKTGRISGLAARYHDLGSNSPNLWVHVNAGSITNACVYWSKSGNGNWTSASFNIGTIPVTLAYSFNCDAFGQPGNFAVDYQSNYSFGDFLLPVNTIAMSGSGTSALHPAYPGHDYWSDVTSECDWTVTTRNYTP
jgi:hypothetical protein